MSIPGAGLTLRNLLGDEFARRQPGLHEFDFKLLNASQLNDTLEKLVTLYLYRVSLDPTRRYVELPRTPDDAAHNQRRTALSLELRYLVTVWSKEAETEQLVLGEVMSILDTHAIIGGDLLDQTYPWDEGTALKVVPDSLSNEDLLRLWDGLTPQYRLSVPYVVRTVRVSSGTRPSEGPVIEQVRAYAPSVR